MNEDEIIELMIENWESKNKLICDNFSFTELEKHWMKMAFKTGYDIAKIEYNKKNNP